MEPKLDVARAVGLPIEGTGVRVDEGLRAADDVYCAGDIALNQHPGLGEEMRVEHWEVAKHHGRGIALSIAPGYAPVTRLPYFWSDQYEVSLEYRGHASGEDLAVWRGDKEGLTFSVFYIRGGLIPPVLSINSPQTTPVAATLIQPPKT